MAALRMKADLHVLLSSAIHLALARDVTSLVLQLSLRHSVHRLGGGIVYQYMYAEFPINQVPSQAVHFISIILFHVCIHLKACLCECVTRLQNQLTSISVWKLNKSTFCQLLPSRARIFQYWRAKKTEK